MKKKLSEQDNFSYLLSSLIFILFMGAFTDQFFSGMGQKVLIAAMIITMIIGIWSIRSSRYLFAIGMTLLLLDIASGIFIILFDRSDLNFIHIIFLLIFFILTLQPAIEQTLFSPNISNNSIIGSICIFLLLGLIWTMVYLLLIEFIPESFSGITSNNWHKNFPELIYLSFIILTTLGFGDLLPVAPLARFLVYIEAIAGTFYMALIVSSLVSAIPSIKNISKEDV